MRMQIARPCPFCGSESIGHGSRWFGRDSYTGSFYHFAHCRDCMAQGPPVKVPQDDDVPSDIRQQVIRTWNERVE